MEHQVDGGAPAGGAAETGAGTEAAGVAAAAGQIGGAAADGQTAGAGSDAGGGAAGPLVFASVVRLFEKASDGSRRCVVVAEIGRNGDGAIDAVTVQETD